MDTKPQKILISRLWFGLEILCYLANIKWYICRGSNPMPWCKKHFVIYLKHSLRICYHTLFFFSFIKILPYKILHLGECPIILSDYGSFGTKVLTNQFACDTPIGSVMSGILVVRYPWSSWRCYPTACHPNTISRTTEIGPPESRTWLILSVCHTRTGLSRP